MTDRFATEAKGAAGAASPSIAASAQKLDQELEAVLRPFVDQSASVTSIVAIGCHRLWPEVAGRSGTDATIAPGEEVVVLRLVADENRRHAIAARVPIRSSGGPGAGATNTLDSLVRKARELCDDASGE